MDTSQAPLRIGRWTVEPALHQLRADGRVVKIEPKAMGVLCHLAARPGQVVDRESLLAAVWPGVIVGDDALTQVVVKLRKALGDAPDEPTYIQTIPKGGYRLVAPVRRVAGDQAAPQSPGTDRPRARRGPAWLAAGAIALILVAAMAWRLGYERPVDIAAPVAEAAPPIRPKARRRAQEHLRRRSDTTSPVASSARATASGSRSGSRMRRAERCCGPSVSTWCWPASSRCRMCSGRASSRSCR